MRLTRWFGTGMPVSSVRLNGLEGMQVSCRISHPAAVWPGRRGWGGKPKGPYFNLEAINAIHMQMQLLAKALPSIFVRVAYDSISVRADTPAYRRTTELWVSEGSSWHC